MARRNINDARQLLLEKKLKRLQGSGYRRTNINQSQPIGFRLNNKFKANNRFNNRFSPNINGLQNQRTARVSTNGNRMNLTQRGPFQKKNLRMQQRTPEKSVQLIGTKLIVTKKQAGNVKMSKVGTPQRMINNSDSMELEEDDAEAFENIRKAQILKNHLIQSFQERLQVPALIPQPPPVAKPVVSCALLVTNLHPSVTQDDVIELFSDIGSVSSARLGQPGTAVVVYHRAEDAEKAKEIYHNRQLDGIPMSCELIPINHSSQSTKKNITSRLGSKLVPLVSSESPRYGPINPMFSNNPIFNKARNQDVVFTVKLQ